jgi:hypothetical protein
MDACLVDQILVLLFLLFKWGTDLVYFQSDAIADVVFGILLGSSAYNIII